MTFFFSHLNGETNTAGALTEMRAQFSATRGDRTGARNVALIITDGQSTDGTGDPVAVAEAAMDEDVRVSDSILHPVSGEKQNMIRFVICLCR